MTAPARDSATVLLLREESGALEVFMVRRNTTVDFMAGAHVFPGGKVDAADADPAAQARLRGLADARAAPALYVAALRETLEEAGVLPCVGLAQDRLREARQALEDGTPFASVLEQLEADIDLERVVPWTRWVTPLASPKRFDTMFFLAAMPEGQDARHDDGETTASTWVRPAAALESMRGGGMLLAPATCKCLAVLAQHRTLSQAFAAARASPPRLWCPEVRMDGDRRLVIFPDDPEHPAGYPRMPGPTRMAFENGRFIEL